MARGIYSEHIKMSKGIQGSYFTMPMCDIRYQAAPPTPCQSKMSRANKYSVSKRHAGFSSSPLLTDLRFVFCLLRRLSYYFNFAFAILFRHVYADQHIQSVLQLCTGRKDLGLTAQQITTKSNKFLMCHSTTNDTLIFAIEADVRLLAWSNCWCRVQTVNILSCCHQQLFTPHVFELPVVYCLTARKDLPCITGYLKCSIPKRKNLASNLIWLKFVCDFKTALIPAIQGSRPNTRVQGSFFYFCQAVLGQVGRLGLKNVDS
ncbi:conserved hypothetical protein [Trichinella spiralis]|uniref:hypothetical protein n=1 Tax=Trichinella spiralis TaxID=6334 RepID=UPI0001EFBD96|nr:conserved hypothetical protein [Trichinella spiralis]